MRILSAISIVGKTYIAQQSTKVLPGRPAVLVGPLWRELWAFRVHILE